MPEGKLAQFLVDRNGVQHSGSLPPGLMRPEEEERLKALVRKSFPPYHSAIVDGSRDTFAQPIYIAELSSYYNQRICLKGEHKMRDWWENAAKMPEDMFASSQGE